MEPLIAIQAETKNYIETCEQSTPDTLSIKEEIKLVQKPLCPLQSGFFKLYELSEILTEVSQYFVDKLVYQLLVFMSPEWHIKDVQLFERLLSDFILEKETKEANLIEMVIKGLVTGLEHLYPRGTMKFLKLLTPIFSFYEIEKDSSSQVYFFLRLHKAFAYADCLSQKKIKKRLRAHRLYKKFEKFSFETLCKDLCSTNENEQNDTNKEKNEEIALDFPILKKLTYSYPISLYINEDQKDEFFKILDNEYFNKLSSEAKTDMQQNEPKTITFDENPESIYVFKKDSNIDSSLHK